MELDPARDGRTATADVATIESAVPNLTCPHGWTDVDGRCFKLLKGSRTKATF